MFLHQIIWGRRQQRRTPCFLSSWSSDVWADRGSHYNSFIKLLSFVFMLYLDFALVKRSDLSDIIWFKRRGEAATSQGNKTARNQALRDIFMRGKTAERILWIETEISYNFDAELKLLIDIRMAGNISVILACDVGGVGGPTWQDMCIEHGHWRMVMVGQPGALEAQVAFIALITLDPKPDRDASIVKIWSNFFWNKSRRNIFLFIIFCNRIYCLVSFDTRGVR